MGCGRECDCESEEAHDAAVSVDEAYWRAQWMKARTAHADHACRGRGLRCDECGAQLTGDALDDSIAAAEAQYDAMREGL